MTHRPIRPAPRARATASRLLAPRFPALRFPALGLPALGLPALALAAAALATGCRYAPLAAIPEPLPEALPWAAGTAAPVDGGAFLGLETHENDSGSLDELFFEPGVVVERVVTNSPAAAAGVAIGDVLLAFAGEEVNDPSALDALVARAEPGARVTLDVRRGDTVHAIEVELAGRAEAELPAPEVRYRVDPHRSRAGWATDPAGGVRLVTSAPDGPFPDAGVAVGSRVLAIEGRAMHSDRALIRELATYEPGERVEAAVVAPGAPPGAAPRAVTVRLVAEPRRLTEVSIPVLVTWRADPSGESASFVVLDLWFISLLRYERTGEERTTRILRFFSFSSGVGELGR